MNQTELLGQILLEMKIMNQYLYDLPGILQGTAGNQNEPIEYRNEQSVFTL
jgi:hypothetical protein